MTNLSDYPKKTFVRTFDIEAISIPIVYNKYGDHDPNGMLYVLKKDSERIRRKARENFEMDPPQPYKEVQPLVIRANKGDEIRINFYNSLGRKASIHVQGLRYDVLTSDGANVGNNPDTTTDNFISYVWYAEKEGVYLFSDLGDPSGGEDGTNVHGLFGAVIVEKPQSRWFDPVTGEELESGLFADIYAPAEPAFREYAVFFHDELEIKNKDGEQPVDPHTGLPNGTTAISYRSEPMRNRLPLNEMHHVVTDEDISMSSWSYGDPAPPILRAYAGDPAKIRLIHGGVKETHVFHLHNHQWKLEPEYPKSTIIDSISISPQECYTLDILYGAGSLTRMIGDAIFHCHLYPHFHEGMWTLLRVFDRLEDGTGKYPDDTPIERLLPLKDRPYPPEKDRLHPGYPNFINGEYGERPLQPPLGILDKNGNNKIFPTQKEAANFVPNFAPGALYSETCPCRCPKEVKVFELAVVQADIVYNRYGWHDPQGRFFVLKEDIERHGTLENYLNIHYHANIHKALKHAVKMELIPYNPSDKVERPKKENFTGNFYSEEEVQKLFEAFAGDECELCVHIAAFYGLRRSEVIGLKWDAVDFENKTITIKHKVTEALNDKGKYELVIEDKLKNQSSHRTMPLIPHIEAMLLEGKKKAGALPQALR